jgi:membrane protein
MAEESSTLGPQGPSGEAGPEQAMPPGTGVEETQASAHSTIADLRAEVDSLRARAEAVEQATIDDLRAEVDALRARAEAVEQGAAGQFWHELSAADFMNSSFAFAALAVLTAFPFLAVTSAAIGGDIRKTIVARMGLDIKATRAVDSMMSTGNQAVATLTWVSAIILVLGAVGMASTLQTWYHRIYERTPPKGLLRHYAYQLAGVVAFMLYISFEVWLFHKIRHVGGQGLIFVLTFVLAVLFWWSAAYMLLYRQVPLRKMLPAGVATGFCITGLGVVSYLVFSGEITSGERSYGPVGVVLAVISFLVGYGVCLHIGAVFGRMWNDWQAERAAVDNQSGGHQEREAGS